MPSDTPLIKAPRSKAMAGAPSTSHSTNARRASTERRDAIYIWEGKDKTGKNVRGEMRAAGEAVVKVTLRRQGISVTKIKKQLFKSSRRITEKDISLFTRQLATMLKAGIPLLQAFDIVGRGHNNPSVSKLVSQIRTDVETGSSLSTAFRQHPLHFDPLYCNLVGAGEQSGKVENLLDRLATYKEKTLALKSKIKSAMFYPAAVVIAAFVITAVIMIFVIPAFKDIFKSFGADLPAPTLFVIAVSDAFVKYWWLIFALVGGGIYFFFQSWKRSVSMQRFMDRLLLRLPVLGNIVRKAAIARWSRTLSTLFSAGVPLVESLDSVAGAAGNYVYFEATRKIQTEVATGTSLTTSMQNSEVFPNMVVQMVSIGEESGALDNMLNKVADFFEQEVDDAVTALASLMEPVIMIVLGVIIGGLVVAMYLPIFKLGQVV